VVDCRTLAITYSKNSPEVELDPLGATPRKLSHAEQHGIAPLLVPVLAIGIRSSGDIILNSPRSPPSCRDGPGGDNLANA
jgi:hypothetical protein